MKAVKFTVSGGVPFIGGAVGDALGVVNGSVAVLKSTTGAFGILAVAAVCLQRTLRSRQTRESAQKRRECPVNHFGDVGLFHADYDCVNRPDDKNRWCMMREILLNICLVSIALCLFKMLLPESSVQKQVNFLIACFFLSSMLFFFTSGRLDLAHGLSFDREEITFADFEEQFTQAQIRAIEREVQRESQRVFGGVLASANIFPEEIRTSVNISDESGISISEVRLVFAATSDEPTEDEIGLLRNAIYIIQKEVGERISVTGEFKHG
jgi:hypothetical protein